MCRRFNHRRIAGFAAKELQADEIRTFVGNKKTPSWVFVTKGRRIPRASKLLICGLFQEGRVLAQDEIDELDQNDLASFTNDRKFAGERVRAVHRVYGLPPSSAAQPVSLLDQPQSCHRE